MKNFTNLPQMFCESPPCILCPNVPIHLGKKRPNLTQYMLDLEYEQKRIDSSQDLQKVTKSGIKLAFKLVRSV
jgi:hypothetical protein